MLCALVKDYITAQKHAFATLFKPHSRTITISYQYISMTTPTDAAKHIVDMNIAPRFHLTGSSSSPGRQAV